MATATTIVGLIIITLLCYVIWRQRTIDRHVQDVEKVARSAHAEAQASRVLSESEPPQVSAPQPRRMRRRPDYLKPIVVIGTCLACCMGWMRQRVWASVVVGAAATGMAAAPSLPSVPSPPTAERSPDISATSTTPDPPPELRATPSPLTTSDAPPSEPSRSDAPTSTRTTPPQRSTRAAETPPVGPPDVVPPKTPTVTPRGSPPPERPSSSPPTPASHRTTQPPAAKTPPGCSLIDLDVEVARVCVLPE